MLRHRAHAGGNGALLLLLTLQVQGRQLLQQVEAAGGSKRRVWGAGQLLNCRLQPGLLLPELSHRFQLRCSCWAETRQALARPAVQLWRRCSRDRVASQGRKDVAQQGRQDLQGRCQRGHVCITLRVCMAAVTGRAGARPPTGGRSSCGRRCSRPMRRRRVPIIPGPRTSAWNPAAQLSGGATPATVHSATCTKRLEDEVSRPRSSRHAICHFDINQASCPCASGRLTRPRRSASVIAATSGASTSPPLPRAARAASAGARSSSRGSSA